jgi:hypothetical protein
MSAHHSKKLCPAIENVEAKQCLSRLVPFPYQIIKSGDVARQGIIPGGLPLHLSSPLKNTPFSLLVVRSRRMKDSPPNRQLVLSSITFEGASSYEWISVFILTESLLHSIMQ